MGYNRGLSPLHNSNWLNILHYRLRLAIIYQQSVSNGLQGRVVKDKSLCKLLVKMLTHSRRELRCSDGVEANRHQGRVNRDFCANDI